MVVMLRVIALVVFFGGLFRYFAKVSAATAASSTTATTATTTIMVDCTAESVLPHEDEGQNCKHFAHC